MNLFSSTVNEIKEYIDLNNEKVVKDDCFIKDLCNDNRISVNRLGRKLKIHRKRIDNEIKKLDQMRYYENQYKNKIIAGCDEAGRGPLAGPVVASIVILDKNKDILGIDDSKKISAKKRDELYEIIINNCIDYSVGIIDVVTIDNVNILNATYLAVIKAFGNLRVKPDVLLTDALKIKSLKVEKLHDIIKGDTKSVSIAAASIIAKVTRDRLMQDYDNYYPGYDFSVHKGYGTERHIEKLKRIGPSPIHRRSFIKNFT